MSCDFSFRKRSVMIQSESNESLLQAQHVGHTFGGVKAIDDFTFSVQSKTITGIIGPNGAGKSTIFNLVTGVYRPDSGRILFDGTDITGLPSYEIIARGISRTFQNIRLFKSMSVIDNVISAGYCRADYSLWSALCRTSKFKMVEKALTDEAKHILDVFGLSKHIHDIAEGLSYGLRRKVELARALVSKPKLVLLDEPGAGMNPSELDGLADLIIWMRDTFSCAIVLIEHRMPLVMKVCESVTVINFGQTIYSGKPSDLGGNEKVVTAYFGEPYEPAKNR
jgi:branched-chain amino acid transport system ATP-binding protein